MTGILAARALGYPDNTTTQYTYDFRNNVLTTANQSGRVTQNVYDLAGRLLSVTTAYGTPDAAMASSASARTNSSAGSGRQGFSDTTASGAYAS